ncbi:hypothetical protein ACQKKI_08295 [Staphylococcus capitis]|uniref:hypothetical protein n=1 Tax=Staphylococcus TaxID=1279 RepID=UPI00021A3204|nr:hypothetical protein [Staphylococcus capitis]EGS40063.1 putative membrane protein [Staphylococcus capitis VCU116]MBN6785216.1 hypothetical protein [Staphylococcus capitis]MCT2014738.1 hypothetical protein [Staphylococcus capitis]MEB5629181.1 hypothetical protein [Staphylococcus capitis]OAO25738.1 hypothetical protein AXY38_09920 [Staphylococcus capitis]
MNIKPLYIVFSFIWIFILGLIIDGPPIFTMIYIFLTISILLFINIKNKKLQTYFSKVYQDRKNTNLLKHWVILDDKKQNHKKVVRKYFENLNKIMYVSSLFLIIAMYLLLEVLTIIQPMANALLIVILIIFLYCLIQTVLYRFPSFITFIVPFISLSIVYSLYDSKIIESLILLKILFTLFSIISYGIICFCAQPYIIRDLHKNQLFINGLPNIVLLIITFEINSIEKPPLNFTKDPNFSKYPNEMQKLLSNQEFVNKIRDIFYQFQMTKITSEITTDILIISIIIFTYSALLNIKIRYDTKKAKKLLTSVRVKSVKSQKFCYKDFQKISYYGGSYYEDQLFALPGVYKFIYDIEVNEEKF